MYIFIRKTFLTHCKTYSSTYISLYLYNEVVQINKQTFLFCNENPDNFHDFGACNIII